MDKLKQMLDAYRNKDREFPTYDELVALTEAAAPEEIQASAMTLRDHFAGQALSALVGNSQNMMSLSKTSADGIGLADKVAGAAYAFADVMLSARGAA